MSDFKPGDVVNGCVLVQTERGLVWVPLPPAAPRSGSHSAGVAVIAILGCIIGAPLFFFAWPVMIPIAVIVAVCWAVSARRADTSPSPKDTIVFKPKDQR